MQKTFATLEPSDGTPFCDLLWFIEGVPNTGGLLSTASGLSFIAAATDFF